MTTSRFSRLLATGIIGGVALAVAIPVAASAHVHVNPGAVSAGATETLTFSFSHGCDGSPTTALVITIPDGVGNATPIMQGGWSVSREDGADGIPETITFTADSPIDDAIKATVSFDALFNEDTAGTTLAFPVRQDCVEGVNDWNEIAEEGQDPHDLPSPAPLVEVGEVAAGDDGHGHGDAEDTHAEEETANAHDGEAVPISAPADDTTARWLAGGALVAALAALGVALVRGRSPKR
ncbi:YcnI family protein [Microbacterium sp. NPDC055910]|uniref:YcnI family copper-binding membrane protein n=1 Tax=Microbacterium sp. NPDC055910 TaxID=3345659 RepID=UPI0035DAC352